MDKSKRPIVSVPEPSTVPVARSDHPRTRTRALRATRPKGVLLWMIGWLRKLSYCKPRRNPKRLSIADAGQISRAASVLISGGCCSDCRMFNSMAAMMTFVRRLHVADSRNWRGGLMRSHFLQPKTSSAMNLFGLFFASFASMVVVVFLILLFAIGHATAINLG